MWRMHKFYALLKHNLPGRDFAELVEHLVNGKTVEQRACFAFTYKRQRGLAQLRRTDLAHVHGQRPRTDMVGSIRLTSLFSSRVELV